MIEYWPAIERLLNAQRKPSVLHEYQFSKISSYDLRDSTLTFVFNIYLLFKKSKNYF